MALSVRHDSMSLRHARLGAIEVHMCRVFKTVKTRIWSTTADVPG